MSKRIMMDLIVAVDEVGGIGKDGAVPWTLRKDMAHFVKKTCYCEDERKRNVVVMGRKCWESIPRQFRPLKDRLNVIVSREMAEVTKPDMWIRNDLDKLMDELLEMREAGKIERVWNIGGRDIYAWALKNDRVGTIEITKIIGDFKADVKMPDIEWENYMKTFSSADGEENGIQFTFNTYIRMVKRKSNQSNPGSNQQNGQSQQNGHSNHSSNGPATSSISSISGSSKLNGLSNGHSTSNGISNGHGGGKKGSRRGGASETASSSQSSGSELHERRLPEKIKMRDHECQVDLTVDEDIVEKFARLKEWRKMETIGELVSLLTPVQRKLMEAMLRGSTAHSNSSVESYERRINNPRSLEAVQLKESVEKQREMYLSTLSLLTPCNRLSANVLMNQLHKFMADLQSLIQGRNDESVQSQIEHVLAMVVTSLHHPAFSVDAQMQLAQMRDQLKTMLHELIPFTQGQSKEELSPTIKCMHCLECKVDEQEIVLELLWTDGMTTYACRTIKQMHEMHRRLLDVFGMEKRDKERALPYFPRAENFLTMYTYIEELANLPARMLLDVKFADEFADTRIFSAQLSSAPVNHAPVRRRGRKEEVEDDPNMNESLGVLPSVYVPPLPPAPSHPSCPYCAMPHVIEQCERLAIKGIYVNGQAAITDKLDKMGPAEWSNMRCNCCR